MNLLHRLELNGFKSFAQRTVLEFPEGITAIVGPNGSGKSNVIDAIRWLLGEREAKNLRGVKVEDLIFAGTSKRARLGQAQASLHFDNRTKFFPVDFSEVAIARQVSRDGVSQYFINKAEVRLKDVVDFFARARLGTKGLVVISQGNSDVFIQATPQGRREMIEEMLGLREYQIKRLDAERRLKNAQANLEKVQALVEEILPHLRSLKRQTNRWEKRGILEQELRELENNFFGFQLAELNQKLETANQAMKTHKVGYEALESNKKKAESNLKTIEANQPKERAELGKIKSQLQTLLETRSDLQKEIGRLEAKIEMSEQVPVDVPESANLLPLVKKVKHTLEAYLEEEDVEDLRAAIETLLGEIDESLAGISTRGEDKSIRALQVSFAKIRQDLEKLESQIEKLKRDESSLEKGQEDFYNSFKKASSELDFAKVTLDKWESAEQALRFEKERLTIRLQELEHQAAQSDRRLTEFKDVSVSKDLAREDLANLERQILKHRGELASMGEVDQALLKEARETEERYTFLERESKDLMQAQEDLGQMITDLSEKVRTEFAAALVKINQEFGKFFEIMFNGGQAKLKVVKRKETKLKETEAEGETPNDLASETNKKEDDGIEIELNLPRKRIHSLEMLSGGERSLVGIAALFGLVSVSPPPFLVLDEIDAPLDERNARRFAEMLREFSKKIQFVIVTHNRVVMEAADVLYGVTMNEDGTSKILSLKLEAANT